MNVFSKALHFIEDGRPTNKEVDYALLALRIVIAVFFITHGYDKLFGVMSGPEGFAGMLGMMSMPMPGVLAFLVGVAEFFGGFGILLGVFTRFSAFWLTIISFVAWAMVKGFSLGMVFTMPTGMALGGGDLDILSLGIVLALFFTGPGSLSVSAHMKKDHNEGAQHAQ